MKELDKKLVIGKLQNYFKDSKFTFVLLFGSYADDSFKTGSDIDIGVYFNEDIDYLELGYHSVKLESLLNRKIDLIPLNNIYKKNPCFAFEILNNHELLAYKDKNVYYEFKTYSNLYYLDTKPLIEQNEKSLLKRIEDDRIGERDYVS